MGHFENILFVKIILRIKKRNGTKSIGIFEMGSDKWISVFNQAYILILSNQICKHNRQNFPLRGILPRMINLHTCWWAKRANVLSFLFVKF